MMCICDCLSRCWNWCTSADVKPTGHRPASPTLASTNSRVHQVANGIPPLDPLPPAARSVVVNPWNGGAAPEHAASPTAALHSSRPSSSRGTQGRGSVPSVTPQAASPSHAVQAGDLSNRSTRVNAAAANTLSPPPARSNGSALQLMTGGFTFRGNAGSPAPSAALVNDGTRSMGGPSPLVQGTPRDLMGPPSPVPTLRAVPPGVVVDDPKAAPNGVSVASQRGPQAQLSRGADVSNPAAGLSGGPQMSLIHLPALVPDSPPSPARECDSQNASTQAAPSIEALNPAERYHVGHVASIGSAEKQKEPVFLVGISDNETLSCAQDGPAASVEGQRGPPPSNAAESDGVKEQNGEDRLASLFKSDVDVNLVGFPPFSSQQLEGGAGAQGGSSSTSTSSKVRKLHNTDVGAAGAGGGVPGDAAVSNPSPREPHRSSAPDVGNVKDVPIGGSVAARACAPIAEEEASAPTSHQSGSPPSKMSDVFSRNAGVKPPDS